MDFFVCRSKEVVRGGHMQEYVLYIFPDRKGGVCKEAESSLEYCLMGVYDAFGLFFEDIVAMVKEF